MLYLSHVSKAFQDKTVLDDVSLSLQAGDIVALVGSNGMGKTTLLTIILGTLLPDAGTVSSDNESIGYVPQDAPAAPTIAESFDIPTETWRRDYALSRVGLKDVALHTPTALLSGGQKTRLALAKVLATNPEPTVLLLDEPTNNLDTEGLAWLQEFVKNFDGSILLISHDRAFINAVATKVIELHRGKLTQYGGNYDFYKEQKSIERQAALARYETSIEERKRIEKGMRMIQDRARQGLRLKKPRDNDKAQYDWHQDNVQQSFSRQLQAVQSRLDQLKEVERPEKNKSHNLKLGGEVPNHKLILRLEKVQKRYATSVLQNTHFELFGNERVHLSGDNGSGKTTLLKIAAGLLQPDSGVVKRGVNINVGYFSQDVDGLDHDKTALENLQLDHLKLTDIYHEALSMGLTQNDLHKKVSTLSRGQQAKLGFAKLLLGTNQLLILDEPTNHLDIPTREEIETALQRYNGAILFASHDKCFVKTLQPTKTLTLMNGELH